GPFMQWLSGHYLRILHWSLRHRWVVMTASGLCFVSLVVLGKMTRFTFIPQDDSSEFEISLQTPEGSDLERTAQICGQIEQQLKTLHIDNPPVVLQPLTATGNPWGGVGRGEGDVTVGSFYGRRRGWGGFWPRPRGRPRRWSQFHAMDLARRIMAQFPDVR